MSLFSLGLVVGTNLCPLESRDDVVASILKCRDKLCTPCTEFDFDLNLGIKRLLLVRIWCLPLLWPPRGLKEPRVERPAVKETAG